MPLVTRESEIHTLESQQHTDDQTANLYDKETVKIIKENVSIVWERVKNSKNLKQSGLANALELTQSAISKLLNVPDKHPWTERYLVAFCIYTGANISELIPENVLPLFTSYTEENEKGVDENFLAECLESVANFYKKRGKVIKAKRLSEIAGELCEKLQKTRPTNEDMESAIINILMG